MYRMSLYLKMLQELERRSDGKQSDELARKTSLAESVAKRALERVSGREATEHDAAYVSSLASKMADPAAPSRVRKHMAKLGIPPRGVFQTDRDASYCACGQLLTDHVDPLSPCAKGTTR